MKGQELCNFCKTNIETLKEEKKKEVEKSIGLFVRNKNIEEIDKKIKSYQAMCEHLKVSDNVCEYCGKKIENCNQEEI